MNELRRGTMRNALRLAEGLTVLLLASALSPEQRTGFMIALVYVLVANFISKGVDNIIRRIFEG